jgi:glycosyltransferase involved in cell wall biosynthesis
MKISVVISALNAEKVIEDCLRSVEFADEIILLDNSSTDKTAEIARKYTSKIFKQENDPNSIDIQKNFGFKKAKNEWILSIDADERVSPELREEIKQILDDGSLVLGAPGTNHQEQKPVNGYWIPRKNIIFGKWIQHTGWYPDPQLRLFRKDKGSFEEKYVHAPLKLQGEAGRLTNHIIHENYQSIEQFIKRTTTYAKSEADKKIKEGYVLTHIDAIRFPFNEFLSRFFAREGYKDGFHGFMLSMLMGFYHFLVFSFIWEKHKFKEAEEKDFKEKFNEEIKSVKKDLDFWVKTASNAADGKNKRSLLNKILNKS